MMTWLGVGNVQGVLMRADAQKGSVQEVLLLRGGVVGSQLPALQAAVLPIAKGDTLVFATDGVRGEFVKVFPPWNPRSEQRTRSSRSIAEGMTTRSYWWHG